MRRIDDDREYARPPEEYPAPAAQVTPPPPEFGSGGPGAPSQKKKRKYHWLAAALAAGLLSTVALFSETEGEIPDADAVPASVSVEASATQEPLPTVSPSYEAQTTPSPAPTSTPVSTPVPTPAPSSTPIPAPSVQTVFYRTSEVYHGRVTVNAPDIFETVVVRLWDRTLEETIWEHILTDQEVTQGFELSGFDLAGSEFGHRHFDLLMQGYTPDPVMEIVYTVRADDGEQTFTKQIEPAYELYVRAGYDMKDPEEDFLYTFWEEITYPDCFVVRIELTPYGDVNMTYGENAELQPGDVSVTVEAEGQTLVGDGWHMERTEIVLEEGTFYTYALVVPRPASLPERGAVEICITRRLIHYPTETVRSVRTVTYGQE